MTVENLINAIENKPARSAWARGVRAAAADLVEGLGAVPATWEELRAAMLNGAYSWDMFSYGGCALVYDGDIAERYCTPSELRRNRNGERNPNGRETWLDLQARALKQACGRVHAVYNELNK